jgi:hypothetical protein
VELLCPPRAHPCAGAGAAARALGAEVDFLLTQDPSLEAVCLVRERTQLGLFVATGAVRSRHS